MLKMAQEDIRDYERHPNNRDYKKVGFTYAFAVDYSSACKHYRIEMPLAKMSELNLSSGVLNANDTSTDSLSLLLSSDILLLYAVAGKGMEKLLEEVRGPFSQALIKEYPTYIPPAVIWDTDDNQDWVHPLNPAFVKLGTRNIDGQILSPGDIIWAQHSNNEKRPLWIDCVNRVTPDQGGPALFDIRRNLRTLKSLRRVVQAADGMTTATPYLAKYFKEHYDVKHVHVFHNSIDPDDYAQTEFASRSDVRILWQGGDSHAPDLYPIKDPLLEVLKENSHTKFYMWGAIYKWIADAISKDQLITMKWLPYDAYIPLRSRLDVDINICPLVDSEFNRSKSCIKWYEASLSGSPEATLAANVTPYKDEIVDGETGLLYSSPQEFKEKLTTLVKNPELRKTLAANAKRWIIENRSFTVTVPPLYEFYSECRLRQVMSYGVEHAIQ